MKFRDGTDVVARNNVLHFARETTQKRLNRVINDTTSIAVEPAFDQAPSALDRLRQRGESGGTILPDLTAWVRVTVKHGQDSAKLVARLKTDPLVETAALEDPRFVATSDTLAPGQAALWSDPAPSGGTYGYGVSSAKASGLAGVDGSGVKVTDFEWALDPAHVELANRPNINQVTPDGHGSYWGMVQHGTAVASIVAGSDSNGSAGIDPNTGQNGVSGVAPNVDYRLHALDRFVGDTDTSPARIGAAALLDAVTASVPADSVRPALPAMGPGDILLFEIARYDIDGTTEVPIETDPVTFDAIQTVTGLGITVIEPAGNSDANLDDPRFASWAKTDDSGAIMVGVGNWSTTYCNPETPLTQRFIGGSAYGSRVNVQGPACLSAANAYNKAQVTGWMSNSFGGTSGASAFVAGVAAGVQGAFKASHNGRVLKPAELRAALMSTGTQPTSTALGAGAIGPMVNENAAITAVRAPVISPGPEPARQADGSYRLYGTVDPGEFTTTTTISYGTTTSYGNSPLSGTLTAGSAPAQVQVTTPVLTPGTTYHYRVNALNSKGTNHGPDRTFVAGQAVITDGPAPAWNAIANDGSFKLSAVIDPVGQSGTTATIEYGTTTSYGTTKSTTPPGSAGPVTVAALTNAGLTAGVVYHYRVNVTNAYATVHGPDHTFLAFGTPIVGASGSGTFSRAPGGAFTLGDTVNPNSSTAATTVEWGLTASYGHTVSGTSRPGRDAIDNPASAVTDAALALGTTYHYRVDATNAAGTTYGPDRTFVTSAQPVITDGAPVAWNQNTNNGTYRLYSTIDPAGESSTATLEYGLTTAYGTTKSTTPVGSNGPNPVAALTASGLTPGATYHYRFNDTNPYATTHGSDRTFVAFAPPVVTAGPAPTGFSSHSYALKANVNPEYAATTVSFEYGTDTGYGQQTGQLAVPAGGSPVAVSRVTTALTPGVTYHYRLVASNAAGDVLGPDQTFTAN